MSKRIFVKDQTEFRLVQFVWAKDEAAFRAVQSVWAKDDGAFHLVWTPEDNFVVGILSPVEGTEFPPDSSDIEVTLEIESDFELESVRLFVDFLDEQGGEATEFLGEKSVGPYKFTVPASILREETTYTLRPEAEDIIGRDARSESSSFSVQPAYVPPTASFALQNSAGLTLVFENNSAEGSEAIAQVSWDFGDGTVVEGAGLPGETIEHTYAEGGDYTVALTVTDITGGIDTDTLEVSPLTPNQPPQAVFSVTTQLLAATIDAGSSSDPDGTIVLYEVDWGVNEGYVSFSGPTTTRTYAQAGSYQVKLRVTDDDGATGVTEQRVVVSEREVSIQLTSPVDGSAPTNLQVPLGARVTTNAPAADIQRVDWQINGSTQIRSASAPEPGDGYTYESSFTFQNYGRHEVQAFVYFQGESNAAAASQVATFTIEEPNSATTLTLTRDNAAVVHQSGGSAVIEARAQDANGLDTLVVTERYESPTGQVSEQAVINYQSSGGGVTERAESYTLRSDTAIGQYTYVAESVDSLGNRATSDPVTVTVAEPRPAQVNPPSNRGPAGSPQSFAFVFSQPDGLDITNIVLENPRSVLWANVSFGYGQSASGPFTSGSEPAPFWQIELEGTPGEQDEGAVGVIFTVTDAAGFQTELTVSLTIEDVNAPRLVSAVLRNDQNSIVASGSQIQGSLFEIEINLDRSGRPITNALLQFQDSGGISSISGEGGTRQGDFDYVIPLGNLDSTNIPSSLKGTASDGENSQSWEVLLSDLNVGPSFRGTQPSSYEVTAGETTPVQLRLFNPESGDLSYAFDDGGAGLPASAGATEYSSSTGNISQTIFIDASGFTGGQSTTLNITATDRGGLSASRAVTIAFVSAPVAQEGSIEGLEYGVAGDFAFGLSLNGNDPANIAVELIGDGASGFTADVIGGTTNPELRIRWSGTFDTQAENAFVRDLNTKAFDVRLSAGAGSSTSSYSFSFAPDDILWTLNTPVLLDRASASPLDREFSIIAESENQEELTSLAGVFGSRGSWSVAGDSRLEYFNGSGWQDTPLRTFRMRLTGTMAANPDIPLGVDRGRYTASASVDRAPIADAQNLQRVVQIDVEDASLTGYTAAGPNPVTLFADGGAEAQVFSYSLDGNGQIERVSLESGFPGLSFSVDLASSSVTVSYDRSTRGTYPDEDFIIRVDSEGGFSQTTPVAVQWGNRGLALTGPTETSFRLSAPGERFLTFEASDPDDAITFVEVRASQTGEFSEKHTNKIIRLKDSLGATISETSGLGTKQIAVGGSPRYVQIEIEFEGLSQEGGSTRLVVEAQSGGAARNSTQSINTQYTIVVDNVRPYTFSPQEGNLNFQIFKTGVEQSKVYNIVEGQGEIQQVTVTNAFEPSRPLSEIGISTLLSADKTQFTLIYDGQGEGDGSKSDVINYRAYDLILDVFSTGNQQGRETVRLEYGNLSPTITNAGLIRIVAGQTTQWTTEAFDADDAIYSIEMSWDRFDILDSYPFVAVYDDVTGQLLGDNANTFQVQMPDTPNPVRIEFTVRPDQIRGNGTINYRNVVRSGADDGTGTRPRFRLDETTYPLDVSGYQEPAQEPDSGGTTTDSGTTSGGGGGSSSPDEPNPDSVPNDGSSQFFE